MRNVDVTIILFDQYILADLVSVAIVRSRRYEGAKYGIPVDKHIVKAKLQDEVPKLLLDLDARVIAGIWIRCKHAQRIRSLRIHYELIVPTAKSGRVFEPMILKRHRTYGVHEYRGVGMMSVDLGQRVLTRSRVKWFVVKESKASS